MQTIWKFPLAVADVQRIRMPKKAEILTVQHQNSGAWLWAIVHTENDIEERVIEILGTGNPIHNDMGISRKYIGTFQAEPFVWHVFEVL